LINASIRENFSGLQNKIISTLHDKSKTVIKKTNL